MSDDPTPKIAVVLAAEEVLGGNGGAIATWVEHVYRDFPADVTIFVASAPENAVPGARIRSPRLYRSADSAARAASSLLSKITGKPAFHIKRLLLLNGRLWLWSIRKQLREYDAIHLHNRPYFAPSLRSAGVTAPILSHMHNDSLPSWIKRMPKIAASGMVDEYVFCSRFLQERAEPFILGVPSRVIYNGVESAEAFASAASEDALRILIAGRIIPEKGQLKAVETVQRLNERGIAASLSIAGGAFSGNAHHETPYMLQVREAAERCERSHPGSVKMTGHLSRSDLFKLAADSDLFLYPCQWDEPFGMVLIEAMSAGTPCLAPARGGIPEIITDGADGILASPDAGIEEYAELIALNRTQLAGMGERASEAARKRFSWEDIRQKTVQLFESHLPTSEGPLT